jgi:hypothetical protein
MTDKSEADDVYDRSLKLLEPYKHDYNNRFKQVNDRLTTLLEHQKKEVADKQAFTEQQYKSELEQLKRDIQQTKTDTDTKLATFAEDRRQNHLQAGTQGNSYVPGRHNANTSRPNYSSECYHCKKVGHRYRDCYRATESDKERIGRRLKGQGNLSSSRRG